MTTEKHTWVPIAECGELADGRWFVRWGYGRSYDDTVSRAGETDLRRIDGKWRAHGNVIVTHVLSPHLGPIPEAP